MHGDPQAVTARRRDGSLLMSTGWLPGQATPRSPVRPVGSDHNDDLRQLLVGAWMNEQHGRHVLRYNADGTATIDATLDVLSALLYGHHLTLELQWTLNDGVLTHQVVGGAPTGNVVRLVRDFGDRREYRLLGVQHSRLRLQRLGGQEVTEWTAVTSGDCPPRGATGTP